MKLQQIGVWARRPPVIVLGGILLFWCVLYFRYEPPHRNITIPGKYESTLSRGDGYYQYLNLLSIVYDRDLQLENQYKQFGDPFRIGTVKTETGRTGVYPIGNAILELPAFFVAHTMAAVANVFGAGIPMHGFTYFHQRIVFLLGSLLAGWLALVIGYRMARRHVSQTAALYGAGITGLGTAVLFYGVYSPSYAHAFTALTVALLFDYWDRTRGRHDLQRWATLGALVGLAALVRLQDVTFAIVPAAEGVIELTRRIRRRDAAAALRLAGTFMIATVAAVVVAMPQLYVNKIIWGAYLSTGQYAHYMRWDAPFLWEPLFSTRNGLFVWTPLAWLGAIGLFLAARGPARVLAAAMLAGFATQIYVNGCAWAWWFDWSFSARRFVDITVVLLVGTAFLIERLRALHHRYPRAAPHVALVLALSPLVILNLDLTDAVATGRRKPGNVVSSAALYGDGVTHALKTITKAVGNPFSWPRNVLWAARHGVSPDRYDLVVGGELLHMDQVNFRKPGYRMAATIKLDDAGIALYGAGGFGPKNMARSGARILIPLFVAENIHLILRGTPLSALDIRVNDYHQPIEAAADLQDLRIDVPNGVLDEGTNQLEITCPSAPRGSDCLTLESLTIVYEAPKP